MDDGKTFYGFREKGGSMFQDFALEVVPPWRCQLRCRRCYKAEGARRGRDGNMPAEFVQSALREAWECGFNEAVLMGGEPTLHPSLPGFVQFARECGLVPIVVTNGVRLADPEYARKLALQGTTLVLHAPLPAEVQDEEAGATGYARKLMRAYENVVGRDGVTVVAEVVALRQFLPHIPDLHRWCRERGIVPFVEMCRRSDGRVINSNAATPEETASLFNEFSGHDPNPPS